MNSDDLKATREMYSQLPGVLLGVARADKGFRAPGFEVDTSLEDIDQQVAARALSSAFFLPKILLSEISELEQELIAIKQQAISYANDARKFANRYDNLISIIKNFGKSKPEFAELIKLIDRTETAQLPDQSERDPLIVKSLALNEFEAKITMRALFRYLVNDAANDNERDAVKRVLDALGINEE